MRVVINCLNITLLLSILFLSVTWRDLSFSDSISPITAPVATSATNNLTLLFSTYLGGSEGLDHGRSIAVGADGSYYVAGRTESSDFPTQNAYDSTLGSTSDAFITAFIDPFPPIPYIVPPDYSYTFYSILASLGITFFVVVIVYTRRK